jgi:hypothetical protein
MSAEKHGLEISAINEFSQALANEIGCNRFSFVRMCSPPKPDAECSFDGQVLYVEITHVYGTDADTRRLLGRVGNAAAKSIDIAKAAMKPLGARLLEPLNEILQKKMAKAYSSGPIWLLIRSAHPLGSEANFAELQADILVPVNHPFDQIWLLCGPRASFGVLRIA